MTLLDWTAKRKTHANKENAFQEQAIPDSVTPKTGDMLASSNWNWQALFFDVFDRVIRYAANRSRFEVDWIKLTSIP